MKNEADVKSEWTDFDGTFEGTRLRQLLAGLELDPAGRLRWLEARMAELRRLQGKAAAADGTGSGGS
jgi:hypothetical protein